MADALPRVQERIIKLEGQIQQLEDKEDHSSKKRELLMREQLVQLKKQRLMQLQETPGPGISDMQSELDSIPQELAGLGAQLQEVSDEIQEAKALKDTEAVKELRKTRTALLCLMNLRQEEEKRLSNQLGLPAGGPGVADATETPGPGIGADMVRPLADMSVPPFNQIKAMLDDHSSMQIPVTRFTYDRIARRSANEVMLQKLRVVKSITLAEKLGTYLTDDIDELHSKKTTSYTMQPLLCKVFRLLREFTPLTLDGFEWYANCSESGTSSRAVSKLSRPDMLGIVDAATLYIAENEAPSMLVDAWGNMKSYVQAGLVRTHYGSVEYILGHAAAAPLIEFAYVTANGQVGSASSQFSLDTVSGRVDFIITSMRLYKLLSLLREQLPHLTCRPQPLFHVKTRGDTQLTLTGSGAVKVIRDFDAFCDSHYVTTESIQAAYAAAGAAAAEMQRKRQQPFLIRALEGPCFVDKYGGRVQYEVCTTPVGYSSRPSNEQELRSLAWACCKAAAVLHAANLVHRDFRMPNVLRLSKETWMVIDVELCSFAPVVLPLDYTQRDWTHSTLERVEGSAHYTQMSDMHQIGVLLSEWRRNDCTPEASDFISMLLKKALSAKEALQHPWLQGLA